MDVESSKAIIFKNKLHERMLNKQIFPTVDDIKEHIGKKSFDYIELIKNALEKTLEINMDGV